MKTKLVATNATTNVTAASAQKELTGTNSGLTDALLKTLNVTIAKNLATKDRLHFVMPDEYLCLRLS